MTALHRRLNLDSFRVSVVVIALNEEENIESCLRSLVGLNYPDGCFEVLVVDNCSTDGTGDIVERISEKHPFVHLISHETRGIASSRNRGLTEARFEYVAFTDADCTVHPDWLANLAVAMLEESLLDDRVAGVGGINLTPPETGRFRKALGIAVSNFWGNHGSLQSDIPADRTEVDHLPCLNVLYSRDALLSVEGFDESMGSIGEDVDMSSRLRWAGHRLVSVPEAIVFHRWRDDPGSWTRNMLVYGKGRMWLMKKDLRHVKPVFLAPMCLILSIVFSPFSPFLLLLPAVHLLLSFLIAVHVCLKHGQPGFIVEVAMIYMLTHYAYALGEFQGLLTRRGESRI